jgi:hypothetical protein
MTLIATILQLIIIILMVLNRSDMFHFKKLKKYTSLGILIYSQESFSDVNNIIYERIIFQSLLLAATNSSTTKPEFLTN